MSPLKGSISGAGNESANSGPTAVVMGTDALLSNQADTVGRGALMELAQDVEEKAGQLLNAGMKPSLGRGITTNVLL